MQESTESEALFPSNLKHDPLHVLDGMLVLECFICGKYETPIEFDMENHLVRMHKGYRVRTAIDTMKRSKRQRYDHRTAKFSSD